MKQKVYEVGFFVQKGSMLGGKHQNVTVMAVSAEDAKKQVQMQMGTACVLVDVKLVGAQG